MGFKLMMLSGVVCNPQQHNWIIIIRSYIILNFLIVICRVVSCPKYVESRKVGKACTR